MTTLTYVYSDSTAVLGPLATLAEPHTYDLCAAHSERLTAPRGWEVVRLAPQGPEAGPSGDDLLALADAVREAARPRATPEPRRTDPRRSDPADRAQTAYDRAAEQGARQRAAQDPGRGDVGRRGHLRVLRDPDA